MKYEKIWNQVLKRIKNNVNSLVYATWFSDTKLYKIKNNNARIIVNTELHQRHLTEKYSKMITEALYEVTGEKHYLSFDLEDSVHYNSDNDACYMNRDELLNYVYDNPDIWGNINEEDIKGIGAIEGNDVFVLLKDGRLYNNGRFIPLYANDNNEITY